MLVENMHIVNMCGEKIPSKNSIGMKIHYLNLEHNIGFILEDQVSFFKEHSIAHQT
jgi:hypothetical protein